MSISGISPLFRLFILSVARRLYPKSLRTRQDGVGDHIPGLDFHIRSYCTFVILAFLSCFVYYLPDSLRQFAFTLAVQPSPLLYGDVELNQDHILSVLWRAAGIGAIPAALAWFTEHRFPSRSDE